MTEEKTRDGLKPFELIETLDIRNSFFVRPDPVTGIQEENTLKAHYADIERFGLIEAVPDDVATQFDVARNVYIYAWYEYRFFNVAEAQVLSVLEFAIKERIGSEKLALLKKANKGRPLGLHLLLKYCQENKLIQNEGFSAWRRSGFAQASAKQTAEALDILSSSDLEQVEMPILEPEDFPPDEHYDHVQHLVDRVNKHRNLYAHGSSMLHPNVLPTFEMVSEFINQLYS